MPFKTFALTLVLSTIPALAFAAETGRYQIAPVSGGFVRIDTETGAMTVCRDEVDKFRCAPLATEEKSAEAGAEPNERAPLEPRFKTEGKGAEDFDQALDMMEKAMRRFMAMTKENPPECQL